MNNKIITMAFFAFASISAVQGQVNQLTSTEAEKMIKSDTNLIILDVRTPGEYNEGHIKGAVNINIKESDGLDRIDQLNHEAVYIVHCRTNGRSTMTVNHMKEKGFSKIFLMSDGFEGWKKNGLPVEK